MQFLADDILIEVEEMRALPGLRQGAAEDAMQGRPRDGAPTQSGYHRMDLRCGRRIAQGKIDIVGELAAHSDREALFDHDDMFSAGQQSAQRRGWKRPIT